MAGGSNLENRKTLLVVDDDAAILEFLCDVLEPTFEVICVNGGEGALERSKDFEGTIHLLLTDFEMPGISGIELATKISVQRPEIKVLLMSGFSQGMLILNEGWHYLPKPFIASQLITLVNGLISPPQSKFKTAALPASL